MDSGKANDSSVENPIKQLVVHGLLLKHVRGRSTFYIESDIEMNGSP